jgi:beta-galactosidase beta subunit
MANFPDQKIEAIGLDLVFPHTSLDHIIWWAEDLKRRLKESPEYHDAYWEFQLDNEDNEMIVYLCAYRPYSDKEQDIILTQKVYQEKCDRERFESLKNKYGW